MSSSAPALPGITRAQLLSWRNGIMAVFAACGLANGAWLSRLPAMKDALGADTADMGVVIFGIAVGSIVGLSLAARAVNRFGSKPVMSVCLAIGASGLLIAGLGTTTGFWVVFAGHVVFGFGFGMCDVAMNVSAAANERAIGKTLMPVYHAFFSLGTVVGAALGALSELSSVPLWLHAVAIAAVMLALGSRVRAVQESAQESAQTPEAAASGRRRSWTDPRTLLIGVIVLGMGFAEGSANDWLALAMVEGHGANRTTGAIVFGAFVTAMTVGRFVGAGVIDRLGRVPVLVGSAVLAALGLGMFMLAPHPVLAVVGVVLWGLGAALGFPTGMSAAADDPHTAAARVSVVATVGYLAFLAGPPALGVLGQQFGILNALALVLALIIVAGIASPAARRR